MNALKLSSIHDRAPFVGAICLLAVVVMTQVGGRWDLAVYALSFWHYLVYALAFFWRQIPHRHFISDSVLLKAMSLVALAYVFWTAPPNFASIGVMAVGFSLNILAARALGTERTYYGFELAAMSPKRYTTFPYSLTSHPMLIGNMVAYGGMLLDGDIREHWWPFALAHVLLNGAILTMEIQGDKNRKAGAIWSIAGLMLYAVLLMVGFRDVWPSALAVVLACLVFGAVVMRRYA